MKILLLFSLAVISINSSAQKIVEDKKDDFKNIQVIRTDWNKLSDKMSGPVCYIRVSKLDTAFFLDVKIAFNSRTAFSIAKGSEFIFKLANDTTVVLFANDNATATKGGVRIGLAAPKLFGTQVQYQLSKDQQEKLRKSPALKYRIYRTDDFEDEDIKENRQGTVQEILNLFR